MRNKNLTIPALIILVFCIVSLVGLIYVNMLDDNTDTRSRAGSTNDLFTKVYVPRNHEEFLTYSTHPNFWKAGDKNWTAKKYTDPATSKIIWVWSGPYNENRFVVYQDYSNDNTPSHIWEWEIWSAETNPYTGKKVARNHTYGGNVESTTSPYFPFSSLKQYANPQNIKPAKTFYDSSANCQNNISGYNYPDIAMEGEISITPLINKASNGVCSTGWSNNTPDGGYVALYMRDYLPKGDVRNVLCDHYFDTVKYSSANRICKEAPYIARIDQRYKAPRETLNSYDVGCEAVIYAWGYGEAATNNFSNWFKNGELMFTNYMSTTSGLNSAYTPTNNTLWDELCNQAISFKTNWTYTGDYKLNNGSFRN